MVFTLFGGFFGAAENSATDLWSDLRHLPSLRLLLFGDRALSYPSQAGATLIQVSLFKHGCHANHFLQDHGKTQDAETQYFSLLCSDSSLHGKQWKVETQSQSQHKDLKDFINLSNIFHRDNSKNEMHYCKNFLPGNKSKCRAHIFSGREEVWEGKSLQYSLRK